MTKWLFYYVEDIKMYLEYDFPIPTNDAKPRQVVVATIKRSLGHKREQESDPARWNL